MALTKAYENDLLIKTSEGDEEAFRQLLYAYKNNVFGVAQAFTKNTQLAEEIVFDVFLKIWHNRLKLTEVANFQAYLYTIARNHIYNQLRKKAAEGSFITDALLMADAESNNPDVLLSLKEAKELIHTVVETLPPQQKSVFIMSREQGLSHGEIAKQLHISQHTVKRHMNKALHTIRDGLADAGILVIFMAMFCMVK